MLHNLCAESMINLSHARRVLFVFIDSWPPENVADHILIKYWQAIEQSKRYDGLVIQSKNISGPQDLTNFARNTPITAALLRIPKKIFAPPQPPAPEGEESLEYNVSQNVAINRLIKRNDSFIPNDRTIYLRLSRTSSLWNVKHLCNYVRR